MLPSGLQSRLPMDGIRRPSSQNWRESRMMRMDERSGETIGDDKERSRDWPACSLNSHYFGDLRGLMSVSSNHKRL